MGSELCQLCYRVEDREREAKYPLGVDLGSGKKSLKVCEEHYSAIDFATQDQ